MAASADIHRILAVQYYNLRSIRFGQYSVLSELRASGVENPSEYITFHGMRNWSVLMGKLVQEIVYVHSKLMIVDDRHVICGSANLNDRSLLGSRDSEVAALIQDEELFEAHLSGQKVAVGKYARSLRQKIFRIHLASGLDEEDCACDRFYDRFKQVWNF